MISREQFDDRIDALYASQRNMCAAKKWKSGKRAGMVRVEKRELLFTKSMLWDALWLRVGLNAIPCPYCTAPIDILSLTLDHIVPRSQNGPMSLANMDAICTDCNREKGAMTHDGFAALVAFKRTLCLYDQAELTKRLKAADMGLRNRFFPHAKKQAGPATPPAPRPPQQRLLEEPF
jgi:hypothetical protein